jgi:hypothetical protein
LSGPEAAEWLKEGERGKIAAILAETLEGW